MKDRITCFKLNWYNHNEHCVEDVAEEEIAIYYKNKHMVFKKFNGYGIASFSEIVHVDKSKVDAFFNLLEKIHSEWKADYKIPVFDGSAWKIRMWHSSCKVEKICGTIKTPPFGEEIERIICSFIVDGKSTITPKLFGVNTLF